MKMILRRRRWLWTHRSYIHGRHEYSRWGISYRESFCWHRGWPMSRKSIDGGWEQVINAGPWAATAFRGTA